MSKAFKKLFKSILIIVFCGIIGTIFLILSYYLPTDRIKSHIQEGTFIYNKTGVYPEIVDGYSTTILDLYTDAIMLENAMCPVDNPIKDAMLVPGVHVAGYESSEVNSVLDYVNDVQGIEVYISNYPRYWHGYLFVLKFLLTLFSFSDLQMINAIVQSFLWLILVAEFIIKGLKRYLPALFAFVIVMHPMETAMSLQITDCFIITAVASIVVLKFGNAKIIKENDGLIVFLLTGICTSYFDFLTYPLVTLGIPLAILLLLQPQGNSIKSNTIIMLKNSFYWSLGYIGMWAMKWIIGSIILKENLFTDALNQVGMRISTEGIDDVENISRFMAIIRNVSGFAKWTYLGFMLFIIVWILFNECEIRKREKLARYYSIYKVIDTIPFLVLSIYPFIWYLIVSNHSIIHPRLAYREMGIFIFSFMIFIIKILSRNEKIEGNKKN